MKKITTRDIRFFILGVLAMFLLMFDWQETKQAFMDGYNAARRNNTERIDAN